MDITITEEFWFQVIKIMIYIAIMAIVYDYIKNIRRDKDLIKNKTRKNKFSKRKKIICYIGLLVAFILLGRDSNGVGVFADKILPPLKGDTWEFYYASIITMAIMYFSVKVINDESEQNLLDTVFKRWCAVFVILYIFSEIWDLIFMFLQ